MLHRFEATARVDAGQRERRVDGTALQLVSVLLTDAGPVIDEDGRERRRPDAISYLRPSEARALAIALLALADHAEQTEDRA
jgi:hypothetical protein